jgi:MFS family permease
MIAGHNWRLAYLLGLAPAILVLAVRFWIREPERWRHANAECGNPAAASAQQGGAAAARSGKFRDLWHDRTYRRRALLGLLLASVGLAGYWGVFVAGQNLAETMLARTGMDPKRAASKAQFAYGFVQNIGGGVGMFAMGPLCAWLGRRRAFILMHVATLVVIPLTCLAPQTYGQLLVLLPIFGLFVGGMHAGYAVYFPELFPTRFRATGSGLCFNGGRLVAAPMLWFSAWLKGRPGMDLRWAITILGLVYVVGLFVSFIMPETKGKPLED